MTATQARPWYVSDKACDEYRQAAHDDGDFRMLKSVKILRSIVVNVGTMLLFAYLASLGGDPLILAGMAFVLLGGYNGLEVGDYLALVQAYQEVQQGGDETGGDGDG